MSNTSNKTETNTDQGPSRKRHIVHLVGTVSGGGVQRLILGLTATPALRSYRHSVVCVLDVAGEFMQEFKDRGIELWCCPFLWPTRLPSPSYRLSKWIRRALVVTFPRRFSRLLKQLGADLVHTHESAHVKFQAHAILGLARLPWVWTLHGLYEPEERELARWLSAEAMAGKSRACITADSHAVADHFCKLGFGRRAAIKVVYPGADVGQFTVRTPRQPGWRQQWGIPEAALVFGTAGRLIHQKAHEILIRAAADVVRNTPLVHFVIAGRGKLEIQLREEIARLHLQQNVHLIGFQNNVPAFLRELDVFVLPSRSEGFPLALIEALAAGMPCIATTAGGVPEMIGRDGGLIVPHDSPEALVEALNTMLDPSVREAFAARAPKVAFRFSFERSAEAFAAVYAELWQDL